MDPSALSAAIPPDLLPYAARLLERSDFASEAELFLTSAWANFVPRPDNPAMDDYQSAFVNDRSAMSFFLKGNAAGGTTAAAHKCAQFLLSTPPPRHDMPFWVIGDTLEQSTECCWKEKLVGEGHLPECEIDRPRIVWGNVKSEQPRTVPLKPWPGQPDRNWTIEFRSHEQGRKAFQARSIGGFWFSEQFPYTLLLEVFRGVRDYCFPGGQFAEFTPLEPELCVWMQGVIDKPPPGWKVYYGNTESNKHNLQEGWYEQYAAAVPDEIAATRLRGKLAGFEGVIYQSFRTSTHVPKDGAGFDFPANVTHSRGIDWGASEAHPQYCVWGYKDGRGDWWIYDEYWSIDQTALTIDHAIEIIARSVAWGWPAPACLEKLHPPIYRHLAMGVQKRLEETGRFNPPLTDHKFGYTYADPSRPGEIAEFGRYGILMANAANSVYDGINTVRSFLKVNPFSGKPRMHIHSRCVHLIESIQKYRWKPAPKWNEGAFVAHAAPAPEPLKKGDDECDGLRYLVYTESRGLNEVPDSTDRKALAPPRKNVQLERTNGHIPGTNGRGTSHHGGNGVGGGWRRA